MHLSIPYFRWRQNRLRLCHLELTKGSNQYSEQVKLLQSKIQIIFTFLCVCVYVSACLSGEGDPRWGY